MTVHPLVKALLSRPERLAEQAGACVALVSAEAAEAVQHVRRRAVLGAASVACAIVGVLLGGISLLALAVVPVSAMPAPWALGVVPGVPLLGALLLGIGARRSPGVPWSDRLGALGERLRGQWASAPEAGETPGPDSPWVQRHPQAALLLAVGAGAALAAARPWRWPAVRRYARALPRLLARWTGEMLVQAPLQTWLAGLILSGVQQAARPAPARPKEETRVH